jgi:ribosomal protein L37AE/L43A
MICPTCKIALLKCKKLDLVYWYCTRCKCTIESTSNSEDKPIDYNFPKFERSELIDTSQTQIFK